MPKVAQRPACPIIHGKRRYMITPRMVRMEGVKTPPNAPNFLAFATLVKLRLGLLTSIKVKIN
jgi:hypothetical protein